MIFITISRVVPFFGLVALVTMVNPTMAQTIPITPGKSTEQSFKASVIREGQATTVTVPSLVFVPPSYAERDNWPLLVFLHGYGESGDGNSGNGDFERLRIHGPIKVAEARGDFDFIVFSPQAPEPLKGKDPDSLSAEERRKLIVEAWRPDVLLDVIRQVQSGLKINPRRIYVTGLSMGGFGTWRLCSTYPEWFAAAVPICGGGDKEFGTGLKDVPVWAFHGAKDGVVPVSDSESMIEAVHAAGGDAKLTVYPEAEHDSWTMTYQNPDVYRWLMAHEKARSPLEVAPPSPVSSEKP